MSAARQPSPRASVILLYHHIGDITEPFSQFVSAERFAAHMEIVARHRPVTLGALAREVRERSVAPGGVAITFDDGYANNLKLAKPVLERAGVPATVYVTTGVIGSDRTFWWNDLAAALSPQASARGEIRLRAGGEEQVWTAGDVRNPGTLYEIWAWLRRQSQTDAVAAVDAVRAWVGLPPAGLTDERMRFMTVAELRELVASGAIEVGAHTRTHAMLSARSPRQQRDEIGGSRADLEGWLERPVTSFAYPFGARSSEYRATAVRTVRAAGFESAVSTTRRHVDARSPLLELPRFPVADISAEEFEVSLAGLLAPARSRRRPTRARLLRPLVERLSVPGRL